MSPEDANVRLAAAGMPAVTQRNWAVHVVANPNDPKWLNSPLCSGGNCRAQIGTMDNTFANFAWDLNTGSGATIKVAVIDSGVKTDHEDLAGTYSGQGWDFVGTDPIPEDGCDHGTGVAGVIAAQWNNGKGIAGMAKSNVQFMAAKVVDNSCNGFEWDTADAVNWAKDNGAHIINLSLCISGTSHPWMDPALQNAWNSGKLIIGAAGNTGNGQTHCGLTGGQVTYPASHATVLAVSALAPDNNIALFSARGSKIEISAPGDDIVTTSSAGIAAYSRRSGTSFAAPHVSGAAAWAWVRSSTMGRDTLLYNLKNTATEIYGQSGRSDLYGYGVVNAYKVAMCDFTSCQDDAGSGLDAGNSCPSGTTLPASNPTALGYKGFLRGTDTNDYFNTYYIVAPAVLYVTMTPSQGVDFDLYVYDPNCNYVPPAATKGRSYSDALIVNVGSGQSGYWKIRVALFSGSGSYYITNRIDVDKTAIKGTVTNYNCAAYLGLRFDFFQLKGDATVTLNSHVVVKIILRDLGTGNFDIAPNAGEMPNYGIGVGARGPGSTWKDFGWSWTTHLYAGQPTMEVWAWRSVDQIGSWTFWATLYTETNGWCSTTVISVTVV